MKDSYTELMSKFVLMSSAGEHFLVSQWDSKIKSPADMSSYELASTIQNRFLTPQCKQIRLPIEVKDRGIHFPLKSQEPKKSSDSNKQKPKPAPNVLIGRSTKSHVIGSKANDSVTANTAKHQQQQSKRKLEQGQVWDERLCTICKESGRLEKVYQSHDTDNCRFNSKKTKTNDNSKK